MTKFLEVVGVVGGIIVISAFVLIVGAVGFYLLVASNGKNPFQ